MACILAPAGTVVTIGSLVDVAELIVGGGVNDVRVDCASTGGFVHPVRSWVRTGSTLDLTNCSRWGNYRTRYLEVEGTLRVGARDLTADTLNVFGTTDLTDATVVATQLYVHGSGRLAVQGTSTIHLNPGSHSMYGGVNGAGSVTIRGPAAHITFGGSRAPARPTGIAAALRFQDIDVTLANSPQGTVDYESTTIGWALFGDVPAGLDLRLISADSVRWRATSGTVVTNDGSITVETPVLSTAAIRNRGRLRFSTAARTAEVDSIVNASNGSVTVEGSFLLQRPLGTFRNYGLVTVNGGAELRVRNTFLSETSGRQVGQLRLIDAGTVLGTGSLGDVVVDSGTVSPGLGATPRATLDAGSLVLSRGATLLLDIAGTSNGQYDMITTRGAIHAAGTLDVRTITPFIGGLCGQTIPLIRYFGTRTGSFHRTLGTSLASDRAWRVADINNQWWATGGDPRLTLGTSVASLALAEGGTPSVVYHCLGRQPTADVDATLAGRRNQLDITPGQLTFPRNSWAWPQFAIVTPWDDTVAEGTHADTVSYSLASSDPSFQGAAVPGVPVTITDNDATVAADLAVSLVSAPTTVNSNQVFAARFRVTNNGPAASTGSTFTVTPMSGLTFLASQAGVSCTPASGVLTCTIGALASGTQLEFFVELRAGATGSYANTVRVTGIEGDLVPSNDSFIWNLTVN